MYSILSVRVPKISVQIRDRDKVSSVFPRTMHCLRMTGFSGGFHEHDNMSVLCSLLTSNVFKCGAWVLTLRTEVLYPLPEVQP
jgi:hypothetical protein